MSLSRQLVCIAKFTVVFVLAFAASASTELSNANSISRIVPPAAGYSFRHVDYVYSVQWGFFHAGTSSVHLESTKNGVHVTATADSSGMPDKFFKVHDRFDASVDPRTFCTSQVQKRNEEGLHRRELTITLDYQHGKSHVDLKDLKTSETRHTDLDIPSCVTDVISGFFYVASRPLTLGYSEVFPVNDNGRTSDVKITVEGHDTIKNPAGQFQTLRVKAEPVAGAMKGKGVLWVWFTDDARRAPVQMKSKLAFATFLFQLQQMSPPPGGH